MAKAKKSTTTARRKPAADKVKRPTVLVLEGLSGAASAVKRAGGNATGVSPFNLNAVDKALRGDFDALLLTGGGDVDPRLYGEKPKKETYGVNETRDLAEWMALDEAKERGVPVLGICRGHQLMVVHNGGRLKQHITGHRGIDHPVGTEAGTRFRELVGETMMTVSLHHQVALRHGRGFRPAARSKEGYIEAVESTDGRCLGVQFHPEMNFGTNADSRKIFRWLVTEAATRAGMKVPAERKPTKQEQWWDDGYYRGGYGTGRNQMTSTQRKPKNRKAGTTTRPTALRGQLPLTSEEFELRMLPRVSDSAASGHAPSKPKRNGRNPVTITWQCPHCPLRFDEMEDRDDHVVFIHGDLSVWGLEPPTGHPDWD